MSETVATLNVSIFHQNIADLSKKTLLVEYEAALKNYPIILCLSETWLTNLSVNAAHIKGYSMINYFVRDDMARGGVSIYVRSDVDAVPLNCNTFSRETFFECTGVVVKNLKLVTVVLYRIPKADINIFLDCLNKLLLHICQKFPKYLITVCGDINIDNLLINDPNVSS